jgi:hypothetical protein
MKPELSYPIRSVTIPACDQHEGYYKTTVRLYWVCPKCHHPRGDVRFVLSFDGSLRMSVYGWTNPCGHIDKYFDVRQEAKDNLLNLTCTEKFPNGNQDPEVPAGEPAAETQERNQYTNV